MNFYIRNNIARAGGFARLVRITALLFAALAIGKCAFGQVAFTSPFSVRISGDTTEVRHSKVDVTIGRALTVRLHGGREYSSAVTVAEDRPAGTMYILADGIVHHTRDRHGQIIAWIGSAGKWIFYDYIPIGVCINTKR